MKFTEEIIAGITFALVSLLICIIMDIWFFESYLATILLVSVYGLIFSLGDHVIKLIFDSK